jgi:hypothetical protein
MGGGARGRGGGVNLLGHPFLNKKGNKKSSSHLTNQINSRRICGFKIEGKGFIIKIFVDLRSKIGYK